MYKIIGGDQKQYGPVSADDLRRWIREGRLNGQSFAQLEGSGDWKPLAVFPEFAEALRAQAAPPPPPSGTMLPANLADWRSQLLATPSAVPIGRCLSLSWKLLTANFGLLFGATALVWLIEAVFQCIPLINLVYWVMQGVLYGGLYLVFLKRIRGQPAAVGDVFAGFSSLFPQLLLAGLLTSLLCGIGFAFCFVPGLYLLVVWIFSIPLVADKQLEFWSAMELSRKMVTRVWFEVLGLALLAFLPVILVNV